MAELSEKRTAAADPLAVEPTGPIGRTNKRILELLFGAQRMMFEEIVFATDEWLDRARTETHLIAEFVSKMAEAHSVKNLKVMYRECGQHQIDFIRRDCDRLFNHSRRMAESASNLVSKA